ncbi:DUF1240 domain-containing protein [Photorhabdus sp. SF281]|uniref:DUF1240 domain-containing protein n=1 Tax=Photorhabdus sp. SF281 TaxID=3459527 RepID=UPI004043D199
MKLILIVFFMIGSDIVVDNKRKIVHIILAILILSLMCFAMFIASKSLFSLITMADEITFSGKMVIMFVSFPLGCYASIFPIYFLLTSRIPKYHDAYMKCFGMMFLVSVFLSFPISFYVDYKLKSENYLVCERISWMSDNTYVKDIKLCN